MIETRCVCGADFKSPESQINFAQRCRNCGQLLTPVCAEQLAEGAGAADFDALVVVASGPKHVGEVFFLGGVPNIEFGKLAGKHILLESSQVSRNHGFFQRVDFGPSNWQLEDNKSTNGIFVNGHRITSHPLVDGDRITIGDYELIYRSMFNATNAAVPPPPPLARVAQGVAVPATGGPVCPSCEKSLAPSAKICVACGIHLHSGRPLFTTGNIDQEEIEEKARSVLQWVSFLFRFNPIPIPIASEALSERKPWAIWAIAALTTLVSIVFFIAQSSTNGEAERDLMLWPIGAPSTETLKDSDIEHMVAMMGRRAVHEYEASKKELKSEVPPEKLAKAAFEDAFGDLPDFGQFHWYQLITHMFLHNPAGPIALISHLGGNLLFLLVFGTRVNSLIGNAATVILYLLLGVVAGLSQMAMTPSGGFPVPSLGASGAIMGMAGMYLIFFPIHRVYCACWIRWWVWGSISLSLKVFALRGFWILLLYFAFDLTIGLLTRNSFGGGTAHWAHIGGFVVGASVAIVLLLTRQFNTRGGDILSVLLGKHAWPLLGKPSKWIAQPPPVPTVRAVSMTYQG